VNHSLLAIGLLCLTPLVAQDPANPRPQPEQPPAAEPAKLAPEEEAVTPERNDARQKELFRKFLERFNQTAPKPGPRPLPWLPDMPPGSRFNQNVPEPGPRRVLTLRPEDATGRLCSIPLIEVPPPSPNAKIVQLPAPDHGSKMPALAVPAPPCAPAKP
jgi:hypothetical protein